MRPFLAAFGTTVLWAFVAAAAACLVVRLAWWSVRCPRCRSFKLRLQGCEISYGKKGGGLYWTALCSRCGAKLVHERGLGWQDDLPPR